MENKKETLEKIHNLLHNKDNTTTAIAYGITKNSDGINLESNILEENHDVYDLIEILTEKQTHLSSDYVTLKTTGWAAPLNDKGEIEGAPSQHPDRRRVCLFVSVDIVNKEVLGSSLKFDDDEEVIYDINEATGSLQLAMASLVG